MEEFGEDGDFDGAGGGKSFVGVERDRTICGEVEGVDTEDSVEIASFGLDGGVKFLKEDMFFGRESLLGGESLRKAESEK